MKYLAKTTTFLAVMLVISGCIGGESTSGTATQPTVKKTNDATTEGNPTTTTAGVPTTTVKAAGTTLAAGGGVLSNLAAALSSNLAYKCAYKYEGSTAEAWIKGQKFYMKSSSAGGVAHSLSDGTWMYTWMDGQTEGTKFNIDDMEKLSTGQKQADMNEVSKTAVDVECTPDAAAESKFTPPSGVKFTDMGELLKQMPGGMPNFPQD